MKKIIIIVLTAALLSGCKKNGEKITVEEKKYENNGCNIIMEVPEISGETDFIKKINEDYQNDAKRIFNDFTKEAESSDTDDDSLKMVQEVHFNKNGIISIVGECEAYTGGAHPVLSRIVKNIDLNKGTELTLDDLFTDQSYRKRINAYIENLLEKRPGDFAELWNEPKVGDNQGFYLEKNGIVIFYPPYELSYYSKGFVEVEIPYNELRGFLNPEYSAI